MFQYHKLSKRSLTGLIYAGFITISVFAGMWTFLILLFIFNIFASLEYFRILSVSLKSSSIFLTGFFINVLLFFSTILIALKIIPPVLIIILFAFEILVLLFFYKENWFNQISLVFTAHIWITFPLSLFAFYSINKGQYSPYFSFIPFLLIWVNDVFAFLTGIMLGRHQLVPSISPLKTKEGFAGGLLATILFSSLIPLVFSVSGKTIYWTITGLVISITATAGDLFESGFKRQFNLKDSGKMLPGHGGMLDRLDSLLVSLPFYICIYQLIL